MINNNEYSILASFLMKSLFFGATIYGIANLSLNNSWISIVISYFLSFIPLCLYYKLLTFDKNKNIIDLNKNLGKIGLIFNISTCLFILIHASLIFYNLINLIYSQFLFQTPKIIIKILFLLLITYISNKKITVISRMGTILFLINIILFIIPTFSLFNKININELIPIGNFNNTMKGTFISLSLNIMPIFLLLIIPKKNIKSKIKKKFLIIHFYVYLVMFTILTSCIGTLGIELTNIYNYPEFHILKIINIGSFLQRIESILSIEWIFDAIISIVLCVFFINNSNKIAFFKLKNIVSVIFIFLLETWIFFDYSNAFDFFIKTYPYLSFLFFFIIPLITLILNIFKKNRNN